jgi:hypothetical protein
MVNAQLAPTSRQVLTRYVEQLAGEMLTIFDRRQKSLAKLTAWTSGAHHNLIICPIIG